jgi:hypothetical protein
MPKVSKIKHVLQKRWSDTIVHIRVNKNPNEALRTYLREHNNGYNYLVTRLLTRRLSTQPGTAYELHHIFPKSIGGPNESWNLMLVTFCEHRALHMLRFHTYREHVDKLALTFLKQTVGERKTRQIAGSRAAVMLQACGFQNPHVQKRAASKGRSTMTPKKRQGYLRRLHPQIQAHLNVDTVWSYRRCRGCTPDLQRDVEIEADSCSTLADLVRRLELSGAPVGSKGSKLTSKTSGLARVIRRMRSSYGGWSYRRSSEGLKAKKV